jgi:hypothetical protein
MNPEPPSSERDLRPDPTLVAMIVSTGILIAWAYTTERRSIDADGRPGQVLPIFVEKE